MGETVKVDAPRKRRQWLYGCAGVGCGLPLLSIVVVLVGYLFWRSAAASRLEEELATIRAAGEPTNAAELDTYYALAEGQIDSTEAWQRAFELIDLRSKEAFFDFDMSDDVAAQAEIDVKLQELESIVVERAEFLGRVKDAVPEGGFARFPIEFDQGYSASLTHCNGVRRGGEILLADAIVQAGAGNSALAVRRIKQAMLAADCLSNEPVLISTVLRAGIRIQALTVARYIVALGGIDNDQIVELRRLSQPVDLNTQLGRAMRGERAQIIVEYGRFDAESLELPDYDRHIWRFTYESDLAAFLMSWRTYLAVVDLQGLERVAVAKALDDARPKRGREFGVKRMTTEMRSLLFAIDILPPIALVEVATNACEITDALLAVEQFRRKYDRVPDRLDELVPEFLAKVPLDRLDGKPVRYRVDSDRVVIWLVGQNLIDDGGVPPGGDEGPDDRIFCLRIPSSD